MRREKITHQRRQMKMIPKRQPDLLPLVPKSHHVADSDRGRSTFSDVRSFDGNVRIGNKFLCRRRHLHRQQLGGFPKNGKNDTNGKNDKIGTDESTGTNEYRFLWPRSHLANFFVSQAIFLNGFAYRQ